MMYSISERELRLQIRPARSDIRRTQMTDTILSDLFVWTTLAICLLMYALD